MFQPRYKLGSWRDFFRKSKRRKRKNSVVTIGVAKPLPCSTVVGGQKANGHSIQSSQKLEYFTKILRLIMSLHRDIMELQLHAQHIQPPPLPPFRVPPKLKAEISMK